MKTETKALIYWIGAFIDVETTNRFLEQGIKEGCAIPAIFIESFGVDSLYALKAIIFLICPIISSVFTIIKPSGIYSRKDNIWLIAGLMQICAAIWNIQDVLIN